MMPEQIRNHRYRSWIVGLVGLVIGMAMLAYASVPLYNVFCQVTGFGGTPKTAEELPKTVLNRTLTVEFNADVSPDLPWDFYPQQHAVQVRIGEEKLAFYKAKNRSTEAVTGMAVYNVTPHAAAPYFNKIACFCFDEQRLEGGGEVDMPVSFFIDPAIADDPYLKNLTTVTLSYTFFKSKKSP